MNKIAVLVVTLLVSGSVFSENAPKARYKIVNKFHLQGDEKWDYLFSDDAAGLL